VDISGMSAGEYDATITISAPGATNTPVTVPVSLTITAPGVPTIGYDPSSFSFEAEEGGANPSDQTLGIWNAGAETLNWSVSDDGAWLSLSPTSGSSTGETDDVTLSVDISGMSAGEYDATITISAPGATNTPQTVPVSLTITAPVGPPVPGVGTTWVYNVHYESGPPNNRVEDTVWTVEVVGEETVAGEDCYVTIATFSAPPVRYVGGLMASVSLAKPWISKNTMDPVKVEAGITLFGIPIMMYIEYTYTGDHGWPFPVCTPWPTQAYTYIVPPLAAASTSDYSIHVTAEEDVTVPAGTYTCYRIEHTLVAQDGTPVTPVLSKVEWWSADVSGMVRSINYAGYDGEETQELTSYTAGP
jgi:predicted secreted protein